MDIILLERIEKLGGIGDVVTVKNGYARNYLLPNKKALRANKANREIFEANRERLEAENAEKRTAAEKHAKNIEGTQIVLIRASSNSGQLYGSVSVRDIAASLAEKDETINRSMVILERPIKTLGVFPVRIALHPEVSVNVEVNVARSDDEAELQKQGVDVMAQMFEDEQQAAGFIEAYNANAEPGDLSILEEGAEEEAETAEAAPEAEEGDAENS